MSLEMNHSQSKQDPIFQASEIVLDQRKKPSASIFPGFGPTPPTYETTDVLEVVPDLFITACQFPNLKEVIILYHNKQIAPKMRVEWDRNWNGLIQGTRDFWAEQTKWTGLPFQHPPTLVGPSQANNNNIVWKPAKLTYLSQHQFSQRLVKAGILKWVEPQPGKKPSSWPNGKILANVA